LLILTYMTVNLWNKQTIPPTNC